jgi:hypothetical protein
MLKNPSELIDPRAKVETASATHDPKVRIRRWSAPKGTYTLPELAADGPVTLQGPLSANIPNAAGFPAYIPPSGSSAIGIPRSMVRRLMYKADAEELLSEITDAAPMDVDILPTLISPYVPTGGWNSEERRDWLCVINGKQHSMGDLLAVKHAQGVGHPGHWKFSGGTPVFVYDELPKVWNTEEEPMPIAIPPGGRLVPTGLMGVLMVDIPDPVAGIPASTDATIDRIEKILILLQAIARKVGA